MCDTAPLSVRENLSVIPKQTISSTPSLSERGLGGEVLPPSLCHLPKRLAVEAAFSL